MFTKEQQQHVKLLTNGLTFKAGLATKLPMAALANCKITHLDESVCKVTVPYNFMNKNPFNTTYWAVLGMAAEMASGALLMVYTYKTNPSVSTFVTANTSKFIKTAKGITTFVCTEGQMVGERVKKAIETGEADAFTATTIGYDEEGNITSEFTFEWSIKARKKK